MRRGRTFARMIIAHKHQHTAIGRRSRQIGVAENIAGTINAGPFAIPQGKHAIIKPLAAHFRLLGSPDSGSGQIFIQPGFKFDIAWCQIGGCTFKLLVNAAHRRSAIAGNVTGGIKAFELVAFMLHQAKAYQGLRSAHVSAGTLQIVFVIKTDVCKLHFNTPGRLL